MSGSPEPRATPIRRSWLPHALRGPRPRCRDWNKIEHRLFSHIFMNWRGRPLSSHDVIGQVIAATTTRTGLNAHAELDTGTYPTGVKIPDSQMTALNDTGVLRRHEWHPEWNYHLTAPSQ